jgi:hypothetical protein
LISPEDRISVRAAIGEEAEQLVYLFSTIDRPRCLAERGGLEGETYRNLLAIEIANLSEQGSSN